MARNQEKAHSIGYRFCEVQAQAAELGLGTRGDRAGARKGLRKCERRRASCGMRFQGRSLRSRM
ncbi:hypothetical protein K438DRAFT_1848116, partial [Mycena galopus ATCC 62051]